MPHPGTGAGPRAGSAATGKKGGTKGVKMIVGDEKWLEMVTTGAAGLNVFVPGDRAAALAKHASLMLEWNRRTNLTALTDPKDVAVRHVIDSLAPAPFIPPGARLLDVGSGAGFPGIPIHVLRPDLSTLLIDAARKRVSFLQFAIRSLKLSGIAARHVRVEDLEDENGFDVVVCRAYSGLGNFVKDAARLLAPSGIIIALKGPAATGNAPEKGDDPSALPAPFSATVHEYALPFEGGRRALVFVRKDGGP